MINFRAWDVTKKEMINEGLIFETRCKMDCKDILFGYARHLERFVMMQYSGLKDLMGKEIYEGDIVSVGNDRNIGVVKFREGCFDIDFVDGLKDQHNVYCTIKKGVVREYVYKLKIIGNIYENQDLIEYGKKDMNC